MKIQLHEVSIWEITHSYKDSHEEWVVWYGWKLNIRPKYQREFVYGGKEKSAVIETIMKNFPLNVMYWMKNEDTSFEVLDWQQRTISFCQFVTGDFSVKIDENDMYFHNFPKDKQQEILKYTCMVYICEWSDSERLEWFKTINIAGMKLTEQELRNAVYTGEWLTDAKRYFSKNSCVAYQIAKEYLNGSPIRQDYLETTLDWISNGQIEKYMATHQHDIDAIELWQYFQQVISWIKIIFPNYRKEMKGLDWGRLYNIYRDSSFPNFESEIVRLMMDEDVSKKSGIYEYLLSGKEKHLNIRAFSDKQKREAYERQQGVCPHCENEWKMEIWKFDEMEADHIIPWHEGGHTDRENCQMLCKEHNRRKSGK